MRHQLYRVYDQADELLYIGISFDLARRLGQHADQKPWWSDVTRIQVTHWADRASALAAEQAAIALEKPLYNVVHNPQADPSPMPTNGPPWPFDLIIKETVDVRLRSRSKLHGTVTAIDFSGPYLLTTDDHWHLRWSEIRDVQRSDGTVTRVTEGDR